MDAFGRVRTHSKKKNNRKRLVSELIEEKKNGTEKMIEFGYRFRFLGSQISGFGSQNIRFSIDAI